MSPARAASLQGLLVQARESWALLGRHRAGILWVAAGQLSAAVGSFGGIKLLTSTLRPAAYGELALGITLAGFGFLLGFGPLMSAHVRLFSASQERGELALHLHGFARFLRLACALVAGVAAVAAAVLWLRGSSHWARLVLLSALLATGNGVALFYASYSTALLRRGVVAGYQALDACLRPVLALFAIWLWGPGGWQALLGMAVATWISAAVQIAVVRRTEPLRTARKQARPPRSAEGRLSRQALAYAGPLAASAAVTAVALYADRWTLQSLLGSESVGVYAALNQVGGGPGGLVSTVITGFMMPVAFRRAGALRSRAQVRAGVRTLHLAALASALSMGLFAAVCAAFGEPLLQLLSSGAYSVHHQLLWPVALAAAALSVGQTLISTSLVVQRTGLTIIPWVVNASATAGLSLFLGRRYGLGGVVAALLASNLAYAITAFWVARVLTLAALRGLPETAPESEPA